VQPVRIALATCDALPDGWDDDRLLADALRSRGAEAEFVSWDDSAAQWASFDRVVIRSTWDYTRRREEFLTWARSIGSRLDNPAEIVEWNSDKRYLGDLGQSGVPTVATRYVGPGDPLPDLQGEVVVKPTISAGARDTGRFRPDHHDRALALLKRLRSEGRTAMVQPYLASVEGRGETAIVAYEGQESHVLRKRAVLGPDSEAPLREDALGAAEAMFEPDLVEGGSAGDDEREVARAVLGELEQRFGAPPLYARVDLLAAESGAPVLLELEVVEPSLYMGTAPGSETRLAEAILQRAGGG
jgi:hypothetical protein